MVILPAPRHSAARSGSTPMMLLHDLPAADWRQFVASHPAGNIFHTPEMFEVFRRSCGHHPELWAVVDDARILALCVPVRVTLWRGLPSPFSTRAVSYGGVLAAPGEVGAAALKYLLEVYVREVRGSPLFTELRHLSDASALLSILEQTHFVHEPHLNYLVDLRRSPEALLQSVGPRTRSHIRRGLRKGTVTITEVHERQGLAPCYTLLCKTYRAAHIPPPHQSLFEAAFDVLQPRQMIRCTQASVGSAVVAVSIDLLYRDTIYGWYGAADRAYGSHNPNELLTWDILEYGCTQGYRVYDFGGAGRPGEPYGVRDFKAKFAGELVSFGRSTHIHAPLRFKLSRTVYHVCRRLL